MASETRDQRTCECRDVDEVRIARAYAKHSELVVKGADGKIQNKDSHGHDPRRTKE